MAIGMLALGTFKLSDAEAEIAVRAALDAGLRWIDTASIYKNEEGVGRAIRGWVDAGGDRSQVTVVSKVSPYEMKNARVAGLKILERLGLDYVDVLLLHWPAAARIPPHVPEQRTIRHQAWRDLMALKAEGKVRQVGVSNFTITHLQAMLEDPELEPPYLNQVELHPRYPQTELRALCKDRGVLVMSYAPLGCGALVSDRSVEAIATKWKSTVVEVLLIYSRLRADIVTVKSSKADRIQEFARFGALEEDKDWSEIAMSLENAFLGSSEKYCWCPDKVLY